jgi:hypothetical protein
VSDLVLGRSVAVDAPEPARAFARALVESGEGSVAAVILYGSQLHRSSPNAHSAWDLVVIAHSLPAFHRALHAAGLQGRAPWKMNLMVPFLPPYVTAFAPPQVKGTMAKCLVMSLNQFVRSLAPGAADHFVKGRMVQHVELLWSSDDSVRDQVLSALAGAREDVLRWVGPFLPESFDAETLTQQMLTVSFAGELRPEGRGRALEVWESQGDWLTREFTRVLESREASGLLVRNRAEDGSVTWSFRDPPRRFGRARVRAYFSWSKIRGTVRWAKHIVTFNDWLTYVKQKAERRTGLEIELTPAERKWPLIFLWPKVVRVLRFSRTGKLPPGGKI